MRRAISGGPLKLRSGSQRSASTAEKKLFNLHAKFVKNFMHVEKKLEPYITLYRFNSSKKITASMDLAGFRQVNLLYVEKEPAYLMFNCIALVFGIIFERVVNRFDCLRELRADFFVVCQK
jgi:hypothetical protein